MTVWRGMNVTRSSLEAASTWLTAMADAATGLGVTHGGTVTTGNAAPANPLAVTDAVQVFFGNPLYKQAAMIVHFSTLVPGMIGIAQISITVPGFHEKGSALPVTIKIGGVSSSVTGALAPYVSVN